MAGPRAIVWVALADAAVKVSLAGVEDGADLTQAAYLQLGLDKKGVALVDVRLFRTTMGGVRGEAILPQATGASLPPPGSTLEAVLVPVPCAGSRVAGGDSVIASALTRIEAMSSALVAAVERSSLATRRAELERLLIRPTFSIASSPSTTATSGGARSPRAHERVQLKRDVIAFYGLWDPATEHLPDVSSRRVFTMLSPSGCPRAPVAFKDAILAHIWPSALARESDALRQQLGLPPAFHVHVRNFLILDRVVELAFDADALLLLPARAQPPAPPSVRARAFRVDDRAAAADGGAARASVDALAGSELHLSRACEGHVPFMRLLAWKAFSALRAGAGAYDGEAAFPVDVDVNVEATISRDRVGRTPGASGFTALLSAGLIFGLGARA